MSAVILYKDKPYLFDGKKFSAVPWSGLKKHRVAAVIPAQKLVALSFKLPLSLSDEQLAVQVELKMYNEGGLDPNRDYAIDFVRFVLESENSYLIEAFAIAKEDLDALVGEYAKRVGFLDLVFPRFIAYTALYPQGAAPTMNDLYIHLSEEEGYAAIYQNGRYIGYRTIDSLQSIAKKTGIELVRLKSLLYSKGLVEENYSLQEKDIFATIQEVFYKNIEKIVYSVNFKRSYFGYGYIDRLIFDCDGETIAGLREYLVSFGIDGDLRPELVQCCDLAPQEAGIATLALYAQQFDTLEQKLNFTLYERKKPLFLYESVQVAAGFVLLLLLMAGVYFYLDASLQRYDTQIAALQDKLTHYKHIATKYGVAIKRLQKEQDRLQAKLQEQQRRDETLEESMSAIPFVHDATLARQKMMNDIVAGLYTYRLSTKALDQNGSKSARVLVVSKDLQREKIAKFMDFMLSRNYRNVTTQEIKRNDGLYESTIKVAP